MEHHPDHNHPAAGAQPADEGPPGPSMGFHGMLVLGSQRTDAGSRTPVYLHHLPMFMRPHNAQAILRISGEAANRYGDFRAHFGDDGIYTFNPEKFELDDLDPALGATKQSFRGTLFRDHFERGGNPIASDVTVEVEQVVLFRRFAADGKGPRGELGYLCFGDREAAYLTHLITRPPDYDQVLAVQVGALGGLSDDDLRGGLTLTAPGGANDVNARLREGATFSGPAKAAGSTAAGSIDLTVAREYYLETGDVAAVHG